MRRCVLLVAALAALAVPSAAAARPAKPRHRDDATARVLGTWSVSVTANGQPTFPALLTFTKGGGLIETESDAPGTAQGAWRRIGADRFAFAFQTFIFTPTGDPGGHVVVRSVATLTNDTLSGPFKFDVFDSAGNKVQSGSGTATATRFVIPPF